MSKTRIRITERAISREEAETLVAEIATLTNTNRRATTDLDKAILAAKEKHTPAIDARAADIKAKSQLVQGWAEASPEEFAKRKSVVFACGTVGFRTGTPKLKTIVGWTFHSVLDKLKSLAWGAAFVRVVEEVAKDEILSAYASRTMSEAEMAQIGCKVVQDEAFYIEPDLSQVDERISKEVA